MMETLRECPFCGSTEISIEAVPVIAEFLPYYCQCTTCMSCGARKESKSEAIEAWNRRADDGK